MSTTVYKPSVIPVVQSFDRMNFPNYNVYSTDCVQNQIPQCNMTAMSPPPLSLPPLPPQKLQESYYSSSTPSEPVSFGEIDNKDYLKKANKTNEIGMEVMRREDPPSIANILSIQSLLI